MVVSRAQTLGGGKMTGRYVEVLWKPMSSQHGEVLISRRWRFPQKVHEGEARAVAAALASLAASPGQRSHRRILGDNLGRQTLSVYCCRIVALDHGLVGAIPCQEFWARGPVGSLATVIRAGGLCTRTWVSKGRSRALSRSGRRRLLAFMWSPCRLVLWHTWPRVRAFR